MNYDIKVLSLKPIPRRTGVVRWAWNICVISITEEIPLDVIKLTTQISILGIPIYKL